MKLTLKRFGAYILDMFLVVLVASLISSITFINKDYKEYNSVYSEYEDVTNKYKSFIDDIGETYSDEQIEEEEYQKLVSEHPTFADNITSRYDDKIIDSDEYDNILETIYDLYKTDTIAYNYRLSKLNFISSIILIICLILYFGVVQYLLKGQTLGKRIFNLKVVNKNSDKVGLVNLLVRTVILTGILITIAQIICLFTLNANDYYNVSYYIQIISYGMEIAILFTTLISSSNRGLHDIISGTSVIDVSKSIIDKNVIDAEYKEK